MIGDKGNGSATEVTVRTAGPQDEDKLYDLLVLFHRLSPLARVIPYRPEKLLAWIKSGTRGQGGLIGVIDSPDGQRIDASCGLYAEEWWFSDAWLWQKKWHFVRLELRDGTLSEALMRWAEEQRLAMQKSVGGKFLFLMEMSHTAGAERSDVLDRIWGRYAQKVGSVFLAGLPE